MEHNENIDKVLKVRITKLKNDLENVKRRVGSIDMEIQIDMLTIIKSDIIEDTEKREQTLISDLSKPLKPIDKSQDNEILK